MTKKKERKKVDIPGNATTHFFEKILVESFMNPNYKVPSPKPCYYNEFAGNKKLDGIPTVHPFVSMIKMVAGCVLPRKIVSNQNTKKTLDRWNKDTGGYDGTPTSFIDFCVADCWLVWVLCVDLECNFLLGNNAGGRMPSHLQLESCCQEQDSISRMGEETSLAKKENSAINRLNSKLSVAKKQRLQLDSVMQTVTTYFAGETDAEERSLKDNYIQKIAGCYNMMTNEAVLETMLPETKGIYLESLKLEQKNLLNALKQNHSNKKEDNNCGSNN